MSMCSNCGGKGWIETWHGASASWTPSLQQCSKRCNLSGYSKEVQKRLNSGKATESPVLRAVPPMPKLAQVIALKPRQKDS